MRIKFDFTAQPGTQFLARHGQHVFTRPIHLRFVLHRTRFDHAIQLIVRFADGLVNDFVLGERCGKHRIYSLMKQEGLRAQVGYRRRAGHYGKPAVVAKNQLEQNFDVEAPNQAWVTVKQRAKLSRFPG